MKSVKESSWISFTDLMTALMVIFMFIAISYIVEVRKEQEKIAVILEEYENDKANLYQILSTEFSEDFTEWQVELNDDLSIKFTNPDILFRKGKIELEEEFEDILKDFLPRYFDILLSNEYKDKILEIRIEGHTDRTSAPQYDSDPYIGNTVLSQLRATEVLSYFKKSTYFNNIPEKKRDNLLFKLTANGLSYGRMLDDDKQLIAYTDKAPNANLSRRVEFKIITKTEEAVDKVIQQLKVR